MRLSISIPKTLVLMAASLAVSAFAVSSAQAEERYLIPVPQLKLGEVTAPSPSLDGFPCLSWTLPLVSDRSAYQSVLMSLYAWDRAHTSIGPVAPTGAEAPAGSLTVAAPTTAPSGTTVGGIPIPIQNLHIYSIAGHTIVEMGAKNGLPPVVVLRGAEVTPGLYQGELRVGDRVSFRGLILSSGAFVLKQDTNFEALQLALSERTTFTAGVEGSVQVGEKSAGLGSSFGVHGGLGLTYRSTASNSLLASPVHLRLYGGPDVLPTRTTASLGATASLAAGFDF